VTSKASKPKPKKKPPPPPADQTGGISPAARAAAAHATRIEGTIAPARTGRWVHVERRQGTRWVPAADAQVLRGGRYSVAVPGPGVYRVVYGRAVGPSVRVA
jgi:hypothetical protein